jgi:hypothetical protein
MYYMYMYYMYMYYMCMYMYTYMYMYMYIHVTHIIITINLPGTKGGERPGEKDRTEYALA